MSQDKFKTPPIVFVLEEQVQKLKEELEEERKKTRLIKTFREWQKADYEELDLLRTFIIKNNLEESFDKFVSERIEDGGRT